ncbi:MAG: hypothetical protein RJA81_711 [Planctomycetota bacterium]
MIRDSDLFQVTCRLSGMMIQIPNPVNPDSQRAFKVLV